MLLAEKLKTVECLNNEDGLYNNNVFRELLDKGLIVSANENTAVMAENQDENTKYGHRKKELLDEFTAKIEKDKEQALEEQCEKEKDTGRSKFRQLILN